MSGTLGMAECAGGALALGGAGVLASRNRELIRKWRTWTIAAALVIGCLWLGPAGACLLAATLGVVAALEYGPLTGLRRADTVLVAVAAVALPVVAWRAPAELGRAAGGALLAAAILPVLSADG